jgi:hypothetical protein
VLNGFCHLFPTIEFITSHEGTSTSTADDLSLYPTPAEDHPTICIEGHATSAVGPKNVPDLAHNDLNSSPWFSKDGLFLDICSLFSPSCWHKPFKQLRQSQTFLSTVTNSSGFLVPTGFIGLSVLSTMTNY